MTETPILFSGPMIQALLREADQPGSGKTQTRRAISDRLQERYGDYDDWCRAVGSAGIPTSRQWEKEFYLDRVPYAVGDRLWCREAWWIATRYSYGTDPSGEELGPPPLASRQRDPVHYASDGDPPNCANRHYGETGLRNGAFAAPDPYAVWSKRPSIHMPRWASRLTLIVTDVRVQRLQDISEEDAMAEGPDLDRGDGRLNPTYRLAFSNLWDSINGPGAWARNDWVAAYSFTVHRANIDALGKDAA
jgi:hypothetical protein